MPETHKPSSIQLLTFREWIKQWGRIGKWNVHIVIEQNGKIEQEKQSLAHKDISACIVIGNTPLNRSEKGIPMRFVSRLCKCMWMGST